MTGCELIRCPDYKDGKCTEEGDFVNCETGEAECSRNSSAIPRQDYGGAVYESLRARLASKPSRGESSGVEWETWLDRLYDVRLEPDKLLIMIENRRAQRARRTTVARPSREEADDEHEPGELITMGHCPSCGVKLEVMYGDDEGEIGILSHGNYCEGSDGNVREMAKRILENVPGLTTSEAIAYIAREAEYWLFARTEARPSREEEMRKALWGVCRWLGLMVREQRPRSV